MKRIRKNKGYTQADVAQGILSQSAYSKFEAGLSDISVTSYIHLLENLDLTLG